MSGGHGRQKLPDRKEVSPVGKKKRAKKNRRKLELATVALLVVYKVLELAIELLKE